MKLRITEERTLFSPDYSNFSHTEKFFLTYPPPFFDQLTLSISVSNLDIISIYSVIITRNNFSGIKYYASTRISHPWGGIYQKYTVLCLGIRQCGA